MSDNMPPQDPANDPDLNINIVPPKKKKLSGVDWSAYGDPYAQLKAAKAALKESPALPPIVPLTEDEWDRMEGKQRWDCIVALRGPDLRGSQTVKWLTSSIIRWKLSGVMRVGGLVNRGLPFIVIPSMPPDHASKGQFDWNHFIGHIWDAANILGIPTVSITWEAWKSVVINAGDYSGSSSSQIKLLDHIPDPYRAALKQQLQAQGYAIPEKEATPCE